MNSTHVTTQAATSIDPDTWNEVLQTLSPEQQFLSHHWYDVWSRTYAANDDEMQPVVYSSPVTTDDPPKEKDNLFPCVIRSRSGIKVLSMAGYYYPFRTFLCHPDAKEAAIDQFAEQVHKSSGATILHVGPLQVNDQINGTLQATFRKKHWLAYEVSAGAQQVVNLPATLEEFRSALSRSLRKNHDRRKRSLESMGAFDITHYNNCSTEVWNDVIDRCADVEAKSWLATDGDGKTRVYGREDFWKNYAAHKDGSKRLSIWLATLDGKPLSYSLAVDSGACRYSISGQYDEEYKKHGVGIIADMSMFAQAIEAGMKEVNMGDGESDYKRRWGVVPGVELKAVYFFKPGIIGWLGYAAFRTLDKMRSSPLFHKLNRYF